MHHVKPQRLNGRSCFPFRESSNEPVRCMRNARLWSMAMSDCPTQLLRQEHRVWHRHCSVWVLNLAIGLRSSNNNSARFLELHFGCARAGLVLVPLNYRLTGAEIAYMLGDAGVRVVFVGPAFLGLVESARDAGAQPEHVFVLAQEASSGLPAYQELLSSANQRSDVAAVAPDDVALNLLHQREHRRAQRRMH